MFPNNNNKTCTASNAQVRKEKKQIPLHWLVKVELGTKKPNNAYLSTLLEVGFQICFLTNKCNSPTFRCLVSGRAKSPEQLSHEKNPRILSIESWLVKHGILIMAYYNPQYKWVVFHPLYTAIYQGFGHCSTGACYWVDGEPKIQYSQSRPQGQTHTMLVFPPKFKRNQIHATCSIEIGIYNFEISRGYDVGIILLIKLQGLQLSNGQCEAYSPGLPSLRTGR